MNTTPTAYQITIGSTVLDLRTGDYVTVTTTRGETLEGTFVSLTPRGIRINCTPVLERSRYVTRRMSVVTDVTLLADDATPAAAQPQEQAQQEVARGDSLTDAEVDAKFTALLAQSTEFGSGRTEIEQIVEAAAAEQAIAADGQFDADPIVDGKHLSAMTFAELMVLAKKYKVPGRGVARIAALREGVSTAIMAEVARLADTN